MYTYIGDAGDRMFGKSIKAPQGGLPVAGGTGVGAAGEAHPTTSHSSSSGGGEGAEEGEKEEEEGVTTKKHKSK